MHVDGVAAEPADGLFGVAFEAVSFAGDGVFRAAGVHALVVFGHGGYPLPTGLIPFLSPGQ